MLNSYISGALLFGSWLN